jgi:hypothetical protein
MFRQPTAPQLSYLAHQAQIQSYAHEALHRLGRIGYMHWDGGTPNMLDGDHVLMIRSRGDVNVTILAHWFHDPTGYRYAIEAAIESALAA